MACLLSVSTRLVISLHVRVFDSRCNSHSSIDDQRLLSVLYFMRLVSRWSLSLLLNLRYQILLRILLLGVPSRNSSDSLAFVSVLDNVFLLNVTCSYKLRSFDSGHRSRYVFNICGCRRSSYHSVFLLLLGLLFLSEHLLKLVFILLSENASSLLSLRDEVVRSCQVVELVPNDAVRALFRIYAIVFYEKVHDIFVDRDWVLADYDALFFNRSYLIVPWMISDILDCITLRWVWI